MKFYSIAGINVGYDCKYPLAKTRSQPYLCVEGGKAQFTIELNYDELEKSSTESSTMSIQDFEYMHLGSCFYKGLLKFGGFMLHASAVVVDGYAYCFSANSGIGKSTHTALWLEAFKAKNPFIINDDKPAIKLEDGRFFVYGTPFSGKYNVNVNTRVPLKAICFIERSESNSISRLKPADVFLRLLNQTVRPAEEELMDNLCDLIDKLLTQVPVYLLKCNISLEAAVMAYNEMSGLPENI